MSRESENLSYHEQKRLDYLYSNYHYLNEKEQLEYKYLKNKSEGRSQDDSVSASAEESVVSSSRSENESDELPVYPSRSRKDKTQTNKKKREEVVALPKRKKGKKIRFKRILKWIAIFVLLVLGGMVFMFLKGLNSKPGGTNAQPAVKEYFNGQKTKDGVNILILGTDG